MTNDLGTYSVYGVKGNYDGNLRIGVVSDNYGNGA